MPTTRIPQKSDYELATRMWGDATPYSKRALAALEEGKVSTAAAPLGGSRGYASCRVYPNGEFGVGRLPAPKKTADDERYDRWEVEGHKYYLDGRPYELEDGTVLHDATDKIQLPAPKLGTVHELSQPPKKYGKTGITNYGKRVVRNAGFLMEERFGKGILQMGTLTIPSLDEPCMLVICSNWALLQKRFFEKCKRRYAKYHRPWMYVSVTEIQPRRWSQYNECGLHIHFLCPSYFLGLHGCYTLDDNWVRNAWRECLSNLLATHFPDGFRDDMLPAPNYRREKVKKSAAAYLGKYMSKGSDICLEVCKDLGEEWLPSQWWSCSSNLKKWLKSRIINSWGHTAEMLMNICRREDSAYLLYSTSVEIESLLGGVRIIGYSGRLTAYGYSMIQMGYQLSRVLRMDYG